MRANKIISLVLITLALNACQKEPQTPYDEVKDTSMGYLAATINGKPWAGSVAHINSNRKDGRYNLQSVLYVNGLAQQGLSLGNISLSKSEKQLLYSMFDENGYSDTRTDSCTGSFSLLDHDVIETSYETLETISTENFVQIENYDVSKKTVKGNFQMTVFTKEEPTQGFADTLKITDGHFELTIKD